MKKLCVLAVLVFAALAPVASAAGPGKPTTVLHFLDVSTTFSSSFPESQAPRFGDQFAFHDDIYRWNGRKRGARIGFAEVHAISLGPNVSRLSAVAHLPGGTLIVYGDNVNSARAQTFAVIGGTGIYTAARGDVKVVNIGGQDSNNSAVTVRLWT